MEISNGQIKGPARIEKDVKVHGMITGGATVAPGVELILYGMITGDFDAETDSRVVIHGMVNGVVRNAGGEVTIYGVVDEIDPRADPAIVLKPGAVVRGKNGGVLAPMGKP